MAVDSAGNSGCEKRVKEFIEYLASKLREALSSRRPLLLKDVITEAERFASHSTTCSSINVRLNEEYQAVAKLALDFAMEALSRHMESIPEDVYGLLSSVLTSYAMHLARMVIMVLDEAQKLGGLSEMLLEAVEPLIFAASARMFALATLIREMETQELIKNAELIKELVDIFIGEENSYMKGLYISLYGG